MRIVALLLLSIVIAAVAGTNMANRPSPVFAQSTLQSATDFALPNGHSYKQANGLGGAGDTGFAVVDSVLTTPNDVRFFGEFGRLGSVGLIGFPASRTFVLDGFFTQAFQKAIFQWRPEVDRVFFLNVFDILHDRGFDPFLLAFRQVPVQLPTSFDAGKTADQIVRDRLALLGTNPALRATYFSVDDPLLRFGLPTSAVQDFGTVSTIRLQRAVLQQWKVAVPWAAAGQVTIANGGDVFKELNQLPAPAVTPQPTPSFSQNIVVYQPASGAEVRSPLTVIGDAQVFEAVVSFQLLDASRRVLTGGSTMAAAGGPLFGRFQTNLLFLAATRQAATLRLFAASPRDGSPIPTSIVEIPVTLVP